MKSLICSSTFAVFAIFALVTSQVARADGEATAEKIANMLIAARQAVASMPEWIADPTTAKSEPIDIIEKMRENFKNNTGKVLDENDDVSLKFIKSMLEVLKTAKKGGYKAEWASGDYAGKFLPARFAVKTAEMFTHTTEGDKYRLKLTAPDDLIVNSKNKADDWERGAISKYTKGGHDASKPYFEKVKVGGKEAVRGVKVGKYNESCLGCHGENGKKIHAGKGVGKLGQVAEAISVTVFQ